MVNGLEAVADAIMAFEGWKPGSLSYRNCNPGNLRTNGVYNVYPSLVDGYRALLADLRGKFSGANSHGLGQDSTLLQMMEVYSPKSDSNDPASYAEFISDWVTIAIGKQITPSSKLSEIWSG